MNRRLLSNWPLVLVAAVVAISVSSSAIAVDTVIIGEEGVVTDAVDQLPCGTVVSQVNIGAGYWMNRLEMVVKTPDGATQSLASHGYGGGHQFPPITLADGEYITDVSGDFTPSGIWSPPVLYTIEFTTNLGNTYGGYGAAGGTLNDGNPNTGPHPGDFPGIEPFDYSADDGWQIVGFTTGPADSAMETFGVIAIPVAECCKDKDCEDAPCVKCDMETTTCTAPGDEEGQPHMMCDEGCVNTQNDDFNCGGCGNDCTLLEGYTCVAGVCKPPKAGKP